jgi:hypothetical protein
MDREERLERKIDKVIEHISSIDITLSAQHVSLNEHIRRTHLLETQMEKVNAHVNKVNGALKVIMSVGVLVSIIKLLSKLA